MIHAVESMVISWMHMIHKILRADSAELILKGLNPGPKAELDFWRSRKMNIQSIYDQVCPATIIFTVYKAGMFDNELCLCKPQLQNPCVQKMIRILEVIDSSYFPPFKALTEAVFNGKTCDISTTFSIVRSTT